MPLSVSVQVAPPSVLPTTASPLPCSPSTTWPRSGTVRALALNAGVPTVSLNTVCQVRPVSVLRCSVSASEARHSWQGCHGSPATWYDGIPVVAYSWGTSDHVPGVGRGAAQARAPAPGCDGSAGGSSGVCAVDSGAPTRSGSI